MHARVTRYEVGAPENIDENLRTKKHVLPTEPGQTDEHEGRRLPHRPEERDQSS